MTLSPRNLALSVASAYRRFWPVLMVSKHVAAVILGKVTEYQNIYVYCTVCIILNLVLVSVCLFSQCLCILNTLILISTQYLPTNMGSPGLSQKFIRCFSVIEAF